MVSNHRIVTDGSDWMRDVERRVNRQERRPAPVDVKAVFGTAINQRARQIADWNDPEALRNGWYYTESFGIHSPDPDYMWMGECIVTYEGHGTQVLWSHGAPVLYQFARTFHWHENEAPDFAAWQQVYPPVVTQTDTDWINATLNVGWENYGGGFTVARYRRLSGIVYLQGLVRFGSGVIFQLQDGFKPSGGTLIFDVDDAGSNSRIDVDSNGNVTFNSGNNAYVSLTQIQFPADQ